MQGANETEITTDVATVTGSGDVPTSLPANTATLNQAHEMVCHLFNQSKILDECRICVVQAVSTAASQRNAELSLPFTSYLSAVSDAVEAWRTKITVLHPEMANCDYNTYHGCEADTGKRTEEYFGKLCDLNMALEQWTSARKPTQPVKPSDDCDSEMGSSTFLSVMQAYDTSSSSILIETTSTNTKNPFPDDVKYIMKDVESSVGRYMQAMMKVVAEHLGGVEVTAYLGHIFSTGLNFQTSMWQLIMTDTVYLPTLMREHYRREMEMLRLFAEILPIIALCSIPPPPFPIAAPAPLASQNISDVSVSGPPLPSMPGSSSTTMGTGPITPAATQVAPASGDTQTETPLSGCQKLLSRLGSKLLSYSSAPVVGTREGVNKLVVCIAPSRDVPKPIDAAAISPLLMNIAQSSSNVRCRPGEGPPSNGQSNIKRQKLDESANPTVAGMSVSAAIAIDDIVEGDEDDNGIKILEDEDDGDAGAAVVVVDAQGNATTSIPHAANIIGSSTFAPWVLMDLHCDIVTDIKGKNCKKILNQL